MTKCQKILKIWTSDFIWHLDFVIWIFNCSFIESEVNYGKEATKKYTQVHQEGEGSGQAGSFGFDRTKKIN